MDAKGYWEAIHEENTAKDVSWYQETPRTSIEWLERLDVPRDASVLDVGCGQWGLAPALVERGFTRLSALDVSSAAIRSAREALGKRAEIVDWIEANVLDFEAAEPYDLWHDRAVLHFFIDPSEQERYIASVRRNLAPSGKVVIATFAPDGPPKCSGLSVERHDPSSIARLFGNDFAVLGSAHEVHLTPWAKQQAFQWVILQAR